jgi:hypothetical protein
MMFSNVYFLIAPMVFANVYFVIAPNGDNQNVREHHRGNQKINVREHL